MDACGFGDGGGGEEEEVVEPWRQAARPRLFTASHRAVERSFTVGAMAGNGSTNILLKTVHEQPFQELINSDIENSNLCALA